MTSDEALQAFGLPAAPAHRDELRRLLAAATELEASGEGAGEEVLRTLCVQLFSIGRVEDSLLIWAAKQSSFDAGCGLDVQFLCGAGLGATKQHLREHSSTPGASQALSYLSACEQAGDFTDWTPQVTIAYHRNYYGLA
ncbi:hypothetical protein [Haloferula sp. BvORR071]|uniref:hypothetical protein n=1 Tax=Haloferula sp. BvORR071 TaxID=1396141 RepID=UPI00055880F1|nr:hypothetical protein [Haloferula sp. BvORR071]